MIILIIMSAVIQNTSDFVPPIVLPDLARSWLASRVLSKSTVRAYSLELTRIDRWAKGRNLQVTDWPRHFFEYLKDLGSSDPDVLSVLGVTRPLRASSLQQAKRILGLFLCWLSEQGHSTVSLGSSARNWRPPLEQDSAESKSLRSSSIDGTLIGLRKPAASPSEARRQLVVGLAYWLGATPRELTALRRDDFVLSHDAKRMYCRLPTSLNASERTDVQMPKQLVALWRNWLSQAPKSEFALSHLSTGRPLKPDTLWRLLSEPGSGNQKRKRSGRSPTGCRKLRQAAIVRLRSEGWSLEDVRAHFRRAYMSPSGVGARDPSALFLSLQKIASQG